MKITLSERDEMNFIAICGSKASKKANDACLLRGRVTRPSKRLTDPDFEYRPACATDLRETFRKAREQQQQAG